ncbi:MAG: hypothetical protein CML05_05080 [Pseudozobellia sp.]|nr:hypothetical protein [Pseudozobellia sp.]|tara:strand:- start:1009 stop:1500 length:492 start_codon:yes stop_codon:yes gene_type:complete
MKRMFFFAFVAFSLFSCKNENNNEETSSASSYELNVESWPKKLVINQTALDILQDWTAYQAFETAFDALYKVENKEDLALTIDDLIEKQKELVASEYPEKFDIPQIKSRQKVFRTYILKIKGDLYYYQNPEESIMQMFEAYNAFRNQFNVVVNNTLDTNLILE